MKKSIAIISILLCVLLGCTKKATNSIYQDMIENITSHNTYKTASDYFKISYYVIYVEENKYRYDIIIDTPQLEMKNIRAIAIALEEKDSVFPSIGYNEGEIYHMNPFITNKTKNYYKGIQLSGYVSDSKSKIKLYVEFANANDWYQEYILIEGEVENET